MKAAHEVAIGPIGFLGFWRKDMWLPFIIATFAFSWTAGVTHVIDAVQHGNFAVDNAVPIVLLALFPLQGGRFGAWPASRADPVEDGCTDTANRCKPITYRGSSAPAEEENT